MTVRRILLLAALAVLAGAYATAAERATFILTTGEHRSGVVVAHGGQKNNLIEPAARRAFNFAPDPRTVGTTGQAAPGAIRVDANQPWTDVGIIVRRGDRIAFRATGQVQFSPTQSHMAGPDGNPTVQVPGLP